MDKKRIGKDIVFHGTIKVNGQAVDLSTLDLSAAMTAVKSGTEYTAEILTSGSEFSVTFRGKVQAETGEHVLTIWQNRGQNGQTAKDFRAVYLVPRTYNEQDALDGLDAETIELGEVTATGLADDIAKKQDKLTAGQMDGINKIATASSVAAAGTTTATNEYADTEAGYDAGCYGWITNEDKGEALRLSSTFTIEAGQILQPDVVPTSAPLVVLADDGWGYLHKLAEIQGETKYFKAEEDYTLRFVGTTAVAYKIIDRTDKIADIEDDIKALQDNTEINQIFQTICADAGDATQIGETLPMSMIYTLDGLPLQRVDFMKVSEGSGLFDVFMVLRYYVPLVGYDYDLSRYFEYKRDNHGNYTNVGAYTADDVPEYLKQLFNVTGE